MTGIAVALALSALLGATSIPGHQISAWSAGVQSLVLGLFFIGHPSQMSSVGVGWGAAMVAWALAFLVASARTRVSEAAGGSM
jgi:hypothetical protein